MEPRGDEGEVLIAITIAKDKEHCIIEFPKPVAWIGLHKDGVEKLIKTLQEKVSEMEQNSEKV